MAKIDKAASSKLNFRQDSLDDSYSKAETEQTESPFGTAGTKARCGRPNEQWLETYLDAHERDSDSRRL